MSVVEKDLGERTARGVADDDRGRIELADHLPEPADDLGDSHSLNRRRIVVQRLDFDLEAGVGRGENLVSGCLITLDPLLPASGRNPETVNEDDGVRRAVCHPRLFSVFLGWHDSSYPPLNVSWRPYTAPIAWWPQLVGARPGADLKSLLLRASRNSAGPAPPRPFGSGRAA
jgi:hypothetical protein